MKEQPNISDDCVLVKIWDSDRDKKNTTSSGIITENMLKPLANLCSIGIAINVGRKLSWIKKGEMVLFSWKVQDMDERYLGRDDDGEYRIVKDTPIGGQIYGVIKKNKKNGYSHIIPKKYYLLAEPNEKDYELTKSMFQIPVSALNPKDDVAQKMGIAVGDWVIVEPYSAHAISVNRKVFWFIFLETVIAVNKGLHRIAVKRTKVFKDLRLASRKETVQL